MSSARGLLLSETERQTPLPALTLEHTSSAWHQVLFYVINVYGGWQASWGQSAHFLPEIELLWAYLNPRSCILLSKVNSHLPKMEGDVGFIGLFRRPS